MAADAIMARGQKNSRCSSDAVGPLVMAVTPPILRVCGVTVRFGGIVALDAVDFDVPAASVFGMIGPNGAGKTTMFNCISRLYAYQSGDIMFEGASITAPPTHRIAGLGLGRTFQNLAMFKTMSVRQNVMVGGHTRSRAGFLASALRLAGVAAEERRLRERANATCRLQPNSGSSSRVRSPASPGC